MDKNLRKEILRSGGKKKLAAYNKLGRVTEPTMNLGTRVHPDIRHRKPKHRERYEED